MQQIAHSPAYIDQHVPNGWAFPTHPQSPPQPAPALQQPVIGGGAAPATVARVRWGRLLPVIAGIAIVAFGIWTATGGPAPSKHSTNPDTRSVTGGGSSSDKVTIPEVETPVTPPATAPAPRVVAKPAVVRSAAARRMAARRAAARRAAARAAAVAPAAAATNASAAVATAAPRTVAGGGSGNQLPVTGIETWVAAILGILLLAVGIGVHVNAVRIGMTALLYRRGILLRPVDCARLAQERGLPRLRVLVSNVLHRLLEEPAQRSTFVAARVAR